MATNTVDTIDFILKVLGGGRSNLLDGTILTLDGRSEPLTVNTDSHTSTNGRRDLGPSDAR